MEAAVAVLIAAVLVIALWLFFSPGEIQQEVAEEVARESTAELREHIKMQHLPKPPEEVRKEETNLDLYVECSGAGEE